MIYLRNSSRITIYYNSNRNSISEKYYKLFGRLTNYEVIMKRIDEWTGLELNFNHGCKYALIKKEEILSYHRTLRGANRAYRKCGAHLKLGFEVLMSGDSSRAYGGDSEFTMGLYNRDPMTRKP